MAGGLAERTPVDIHQWEAEFERLLKLYRQRKPKSVLEIGTYDGGTLYHWLQNAARGALVVSVDLYNFEDVWHDNRKLYPKWTPKGVRRKVVVGDSTAEETKAKLLALGKFDFCFIDGDHSYNSVRSDFELCLGLLEPGGIIALHDIVPPPDPVPWMEVDRFWGEVKQEYPTREFIATTYQTWGGIGVVFP